LVKTLIGFGIGILTGIVGLGGGYALVPSFIYLLGSPVKIAVGTSLLSFISMAAISGGFKIVQGIVDRGSPFARSGDGCRSADRRQVGAEGSGMANKTDLRNSLPIRFTEIRIQYFWNNNLNSKKPGYTAGAVFIEHLN